MFDDLAIDGAQVPAMQAAIETYTSGVEEHLAQIKGDDITVEDGVYGSAQIAMVNNYIEETCTQINTIVRYFDDSKAKLDAVTAAYEANQGATSMGTVETAAAADPSEMVTVNHMD